MSNPMILAPHTAQVTIPSIHSLKSSELQPLQTKTQTSSLTSVSRPV